jgi:ornithine cyclodeaminase/alanine dehydrogenase-like protein (mu-crystallin family)
VNVPYVDASELAERLPMRAAIDALERGFREADPTAAPLRSAVTTPAGTLLLMPAADGRAVGVKLVTLTDANPARGLPLIHAVYVLFDGETQAPRLLVDGAALTALRTGAVSGLATRFLANEHAARLVVFGAGVQGRSHVEAMTTVRPVAEVVVVSRTTERAEALVDVVRAAGLRASVGSPDDVASADLVCTCTTAAAPVFEGRLLAEGAHVNAVGSYRPETRELDTDAIRRGSIVVETREAALAEAGDLLIAIDEGAIGPGDIAELGEVVRGAKVRTSREAITVFKSVGLAFEDLVVARAVLDAG